MTLHRTPVHHEALEWVQAKKIEWRPKSGPFGRFAYRGGADITDAVTCVALYQLRDAELIRIEGSLVSPTLAGCRSLAEWDRAGAK